MPNSAFRPITPRVGDQSYASASASVRCLIYFQVQPVNSSLIHGTNGGFSVTAINFAASTLTYQWQVSTNGTTWANLTNVAPYSGVTTNALTITNAQTTQNGYLYRCVVTSNVCTVNSNSATLSVAPPVPIVASSNFTSLNGAAELFGFAELTSPSSPPKKYLNATLSGTPYFCVRTPCFSSDTTNAGKYPYSGGFAFSVADGSTIQNNGKYRNWGSAVTPCTPVDTGPDNLFAQSAWFAADPDPKRRTTPISIDLMLTVNATFPPSVTTTTPTSRELGYGPSGTCLSAAYLWEGFARVDLTNEDTETTAIARSTSSAGVSAQSFKETRGAADFTFLWRNSTIHVNASSLLAGFNYAITVQVSTENYGGGGAVASQIVYPFTASGTSQTLSIPIPVASGKQATGSSPTIALV